MCTRSEKVNIFPSAFKTQTHFQTEQIRIHLYRNCVNQEHTACHIAVYEKKKLQIKTIPTKPQKNVTNDFETSKKKKHAHERQIRKSQNRPFTKREKQTRPRYEPNRSGVFRASSASLSCQMVMANIAKIPGNSVPENASRDPAGKSLAATVPVFRAGLSQRDIRVRRGFTNGSVLRCAFGLCIRLMGSNVVTSLVGCLFSNSGFYLKKKARYV